MSRDLLHVLVARHIIHRDLKVGCLCCNSCLSDREHHAAGFVRSDLRLCHRLWTGSHAQLRPHDNAVRFAWLRRLVGGKPPIFRSSRSFGGSTIRHQVRRVLCGNNLLHHADWQTAFPRRNCQRDPRTECKVCACVCVASPRHRCNIMFRGWPFTTISDEARHLLAWMTQKNPELRCSAVSALRHPWLCTKRRLLPGPPTLDNSVAILHRLPRDLQSPPQRAFVLGLPLGSIHTPSHTLTHCGSAATTLRRSHTSEPESMESAVSRGGSSEACESFQACWLAWPVPRTSLFSRPSHEVVRPSLVSPPPGNETPPFVSDQKRTYTSDGDRRSTRSYWRKNLPTF